tara:strand:+ start:340 stop:831 length:492 start_codon:yes stop_codon:yes gene_type:complete
VGRYYEGTLNKLRKRSNRITRKFEGIKFKIGSVWVDINKFEALLGIDYMYCDKGYRLLRPIEIVGLYRVGGTPKSVSLKRESGFEWNGADIPSCASKFIGNPLDKQFLLPSLIHDVATESDVEHWLESILFYAALKSRKGKMDIPWWKEELMYVGVYSWSLIT